MPMFALEPSQSVRRRASKLQLSPASATFMSTRTKGPTSNGPLNESDSAVSSKNPEKLGVTAEAALAKPRTSTTANAYLILPTPFCDVSASHNPPLSRAGGGAKFPRFLCPSASIEIARPTEAAAQPSCHLPHRLMGPWAATGRLYGVFCLFAVFG